MRSASVRCLKMPAPGFMKAAIAASSSGDISISWSPHGSKSVGSSNSASESESKLANVAPCAMWKLFSAYVTCISSLEMGKHHITSCIWYWLIQVAIESYIDWSCITNLWRQWLKCPGGLLTWLNNFYALWPQRIGRLCAIVFHFLMKFS